ncbi:MAG: DUF2997 domain-containing protein [Vulcanibacillus sp.]
MKEKYIIVEIDKDGSINAETFNFTGPKCVDFLNGLMKDLAMVNSDTKKPEYYESEVIENTTIKVKR